MFSKTEKAKYCVISFMCNLKMKKVVITQKGIRCPQKENKSQSAFWRKEEKADMSYVSVINVVYK